MLSVLENPLELSKKWKHLRLKVEINTRRPLVPGFFISCLGKDPLWVNLKNERLANYCTLCRLIGHKKFSCPTPIIPSANYGFSLIASSSSYPRIVLVAHLENAVSGPSGNLSKACPRASLAASHADESTHLQMVTLIE